MDKRLKESFLLDPSVVFLNHGSFGACPRPVFEIYQGWQYRLERQPVKFLGREFAGLMAESRAALGAFLNAAPDDLAYIPNATYGVNCVARSLALQPGDEILASDHEYGACDKTWAFICKKTGARYVRRPVALPLEGPAEFVERFWQGVTPRTRLIFLSHITSPTAQRFPVEAVCARARREGIPTLIDGAHAPGQVPLDLAALGADFYTGNCHKWMMAPKGAGFLYTRREMQERIEPLVVSWGYQAGPDFSSGSRYIDEMEWTGTHDPAPALTVPAAIDFMAEHDWGTVRAECSAMLQQGLDRIQELTGLPPLYPPEFAFQPERLPPQMGVAPLPPAVDPIALKARLYEKYRVEVPVILWNDLPVVRISVQAYNTPKDLEALVSALRALL